MKFYLLTLIYLFVLGSFTSTPKHAKKKLFCNKQKSWIKYEGKHPFHSWQADGKDFDCVITYNDDVFLIESVAASAHVLSFDSKNTNRDSHALEMIDALTFPKVNFTSAKINQREGAATINGNLNFHGVTRNIVVEAKSGVGGNSVWVEGSFPVKLKDYNIQTPSLLFVKINDEIKVNFHFAFTVQ